MIFWMWTAIGVLALVVMILTIKIYLLQKSAREIEATLAERLTSDTNTLIDISSRDSSMLLLAASINRQLRKLRSQRHKYQQGDEELKRAITNISHDIRTPLTAICGYLDLLADEQLSDNSQRYLNIIRRRADSMKSLTEELLSYSTAISNKGGEPKPTSLNAVLEEASAALYAALHERGIEPVIDIPEEKVIRTLDPTLLMRVYSNILSNALKYSDGDLEIKLDEDGTATFANTAKGLNRVQVGRLFDRFYTVDSGGSGMSARGSGMSSTGLGLSIARALTEQMGGEISAEYERGRLIIMVQFGDEKAKDFSDI
ncbi:MAG: HAMP domain-containing histidine kinase [Clostridiales bacterium]|nr:HAMP domain-containing histidine kinase [Clostridiales bacterium]